MTTNTERTELAARIQACIDFVPPSIRKVIKEAADYIEQTLPAPAPGAGEAVASWHAYRWEREDGSWSPWRVYRDEQSIPKGIQAKNYEHVPLYTHPSPVEAAVERDAALDLLDYMFTAWEVGTACYDEPDSEGTYIGNAFRVEDDKFEAIGELLNKHRPRSAALDAQNKERS